MNSSDDPEFMGWIEGLVLNFIVTYQRYCCTLCSSSDIINLNKLGKAELRRERYKLYRKLKRALFTRLMEGTVQEADGGYGSG